MRDLFYCVLIGYYVPCKWEYTFPHLQVDLRDETGVVEKLAKNRQKPITIEHGDKMARELKAGECLCRTDLE